MSDISRTGVISFFGMRRTAQECITFAFALRTALDAAEADLAEMKHDLDRYMTIAATEASHADAAEADKQRAVEAERDRLVIQTAEWLADVGQAIAAALRAQGVKP